MFQPTRWAASVLLAVSSIAYAQAPHPSSQTAKDLRIISVDVEGGAAALFVTPEGKSLLIDTGWPPGMGTGGARRQAGAPPAATAVAERSSADRIVAAAASLGVKKIDYVLLTHYHVDHIGGLQSLLEKMPVGAFIDHGPNRQETGPDELPRLVAVAPKTLYPGVQASEQGHEHIVAEVGKKLDIGSLHLEFVTSDGKTLSSPLPGAGQPNPACADVARRSCHGDTEAARTGCDGGEENARSVGVIMTFGKTRILDLGDLAWNQEIDLFCPANKVGKVDVYFVTGHGMDISSSPPTVALAPLVAIMQNGSRKGGDAAVIKRVRSSPELQSLWLTHYSVRYPDLNGDPNFIANLDGTPDGQNPILVDVTPEGQITVTNPRNHFSKTYTARAAK